MWNTAEETSTITVSTSGQYTLEIEVGGCTYSASVMVDVAPNPTPNLGANMELCDGEVTTLDMSSEAGTYSWQDGSTAATFDVDQAGTYGVTVTQGNCQGYDEIDVIYHPIPIFDLGEDAVVCHNSGFQLEVITPVDDVIVSWNTGQNSTVITPNTSGTYQATVSANGCAFIDEIEIDIIESFSFDLGEDRILCKGSTLTLFTDLEDFPYPLVYEWSEGDTQPQIDVTQTGTYEVSVESECDLKTDEIHVLFEQCGCFIYVPNAFTPDQDGLNDYFSIDTQCQFEYFVLRIFNRDGSVIFESFEPTAIWGGAAYNGEYYVQNDVYVWQIEYISGTLEGVISETLSGFVTVVR